MFSSNNCVTSKQAVKYPRLWFSSLHINGTCFPLVVSATHACSSLCDWSRKLAQLSQPIRSNKDAVSRALDSLLVFMLSSHWLLKVFSFP